MSTALENHISLLLESPNLHPETRKLIELALEAQQTGKMPDLSVLEPVIVLYEYSVDLDTGEIIN